MQKLNLNDIKTNLPKQYPTYKLIEGGERILAELSEGKFKSLYIQHMGPDGILCNDEAETFIKWEMFS